MKKTIYLIVLLFITSTLLADWDQGDGHKMHFPQFPDPTGYDVNCTTDIIGDDWQCTEDGWICDIHIWISWQEDIIGSIQNITATVYNNIPVGPEGYSIPDMPLWSQMFTPSPINPPDPGEFWIRDEIYNGLQGWYDPDPMNPIIFNPDHTQYFQVNMICDYVSSTCFWQTAGEIYWLVIEIEALNGNVKISIVLDDAETTFDMRMDELILDAAIAKGLDAPYSCQGGVCSSCLAKVIEGTAVMERNTILDDDEIEEGLILTCQAHPTTSSIKINYDDV